MTAGRAGEERVPMKNRRLRACAAALLTAAALLIPLGASADPSYTGEIDPSTNQPYTDENQQAVEEDGLVALTDNCSYDWNSHDYVYTVTGTLNQVHCTAADGQILSQTVTVSTGSDTSVVVYKDGQEYTGNLAGISTPGEYVVQVRQGSDRLRLFSFTLVGKSTNGLQPFTVPDNFFIREATCDGTSVPYDRYNVYTDTEGAYRITYECIPTGLGYTVETTIDRTPPMPVFSGKIDEENRVRSALTFSGLQESDTVLVTSGGVTSQMVLKDDGTGNFSGTVTESGNYLLQIYDAAGNLSEYRFRIMTYFNANSWVVLAVVGLVIAGVAGYIIWKRRNLKIG